jgi:hypothetical protein
MKPIRLASGLATMVAAAALIAAWSTGAGADRPPFTPQPMAGNIAALAAAPSFAPPARVSRLSSDLYPAGTAVHPLGSAGHAWTRPDGSTCVLMANGAGGCGATFNQPVLMFLAGTRESRDGAWSGAMQVTGVVPDSVKRVVLVTTSGDRVRAPIAGNGFAVELPAGAAIAGQEVTLAGGTSFFNEDPLALPN